MPDIADKYQLPDYVTKRLRYFDGQFLKDDDFIAEQNYYLDRMQRHERLLHVSGIAEGLTVEIDPGNSKRVKVLPGTALDAAGRQILLEQTAYVQPDSGMTGMVYLEIAFDQQATDEADNQGVKGYTRFVEAPKLTFYTTKPSGVILLADLTVATDGKILQVGTGVRQYSGLKLPGPAAALGGGTLRSRGDGSPGWAELRAHLGVQGALTVSESVAIGTTDPAGYKLNVSGSLQAASAVVTNTAQVGILTFPALTGDLAPVLTARTVPTDQGGSNERTELILFHGNDGTNSSGPDTITLRAPAIRLQTYNDANVTKIGDVGGSKDRLTIDPDGNTNLYGNIVLGPWQCVHLNGDYLGDLVYGTGLVGFNIARGADKKWTSKSDSAHNGSSAIWGNINGDLYIATIPNSTTPNAAQTLTDAQVVQNIKLSINSAGAVTFAGATTAKTLATSETGKAARLWVSGLTAGTDQYNFILSAGNDTGSKVVHFLNSSTRDTEGGKNAYIIRNDGGPLNLGHTNQSTSIFGNSIALKANAKVDGTLTVSGGALSLGATSDKIGTLSFGRAKKWLVTFDSDYNYGSDKAFILFKENSTFFGDYTANPENVRLSIGVYNDFGQVANFGDTLDIQGGAQLTLNAGSWDSELNTEIGSPGVGDDLRGISFRINNVEKMRLDRSGNLTLAGNFIPSYVSGWVEHANTSSNTTLTFDVGFFPVLVSVIVQLCGSDQQYIDIYSHVPPARHSWDDLDSRGETVYWVTGTQVKVRVKGDSVGSDIYNGWTKVRFKVYAWRAV